MSVQDVTVKNVQGQNGFDKGLIILSILTIRQGRNGFDKGLIIYNLVLTILQGTNRLYNRYSNYFPGPIIYNQELYIICVTDLHRTSSAISMYNIRNK